MPNATANSSARTNRKSAAPVVPSLADEFDQPDGIEFVTGTRIPADAPAEVATPAPAPVAPAPARPPVRKPSFGERVASVLGLSQRPSSPITLPALPQLDLAAAIKAAPEFTELATLAKRWREISAPLRDLTPARIRERVAAMRDAARFDPTIDATKASAEIVATERRLAEEGDLRTRQAQTLFRRDIAPRIVAVARAALVPVREAVAAAEGIEQTLFAEYGVRATVADRYRAPAAQLQELIDSLSGERGNFNLNSPQGAFYYSVALPELIEAAIPAENE